MTIKLKTNQTKLIKIANWINSKAAPLKWNAALNLTTKERRAAKAKLAKGPAAAVRAVSLRGFLKFKGLKGTGLAQPKANLPKEIR